MAYRRPTFDLRTIRTTKLFQLLVAFPLLVPQVAGEQLASVLLYYGGVVLVLPGLVDRIAGTRLKPYQRAILALGIGLHGYGILFDLYWELWWWDMVTHVYSGALLAVGCYAALLAANHRTGLSSNQVHLLVLVFVLGGGVVWEVYEVLAPWQTIYPTGDALQDLVSDAVGWGIAATVYPHLLGEVPRDLATRLEAVRDHWTNGR